MLSRRLRAPQLVTSNTLQKRSFIKGVFGGKNKDANKADESANAAGGMPNMSGLPGFNPKMMKEFMSQPADKQVEMMRQGLEMQKKFGGNIPGLGKLNAKNIEFMESMINKMDPNANKGGNGNSTTTTTAATTTSSATGASSPTSAKPTNAFRSPTGPTLEELRKINLGAEIEELFAELGSMRTKRNHYRSELEKQEAQLVTAQKEADEQKAKAADLRSRLSASENTVRLMNTETMSLKSSLQTLKAVQEENRRLNVRVSALQSNDTIPLKEKIVGLESELGEAQDTIRSLQRKLDRMRRRDLVAQFSLLLNDIRSGAPTELPTDAAAHTTGGAQQHVPEDDAHHSELFASVQEVYDAAVYEGWASCAPKAVAALVASCEAFLQNGMGRAFAKLDAHVMLAEGASVADLHTFAKARGYHAVKQEDGSFIVAMAAGTAAPALLGPFGVCAAYAHEYPSLIATVKPWISEVLAHNTKRAQVVTSTTRSSGPGGQAANTAETQVSKTFVLDGVRLFVSEAQDTRSQVTNMDLAQTRLFEEKLAQYNKKTLAHVHYSLPKSKATSGNPITADRWSDVTSAMNGAIDSLSKVDRAIVECARKAITAAE